MNPLPPMDAAAPAEQEGGGCALELWTGAVLHPAMLRAGLSPIQGGLVRWSGEGVLEGALLQAEVEGQLLAEWELPELRPGVELELPPLELPWPEKAGPLSLEARLLHQGRLLARLRRRLRMQSAEELPAPEVSPLCWAGLVEPRHPALSRLLRALPEVQGEALVEAVQGLLGSAAARGGAADLRPLERMLGEGELSPPERMVLAASLLEARGEAVLLLPGPQRWACGLWRERSGGGHGPWLGAAQLGLALEEGRATVHDLGGGPGQRLSAQELDPGAGALDLGACRGAAPAVDEGRARPDTAARVAERLQEWKDGLLGLRPGHPLLQIGQAGAQLGLGQAPPWQVWSSFAQEQRLLVERPAPPDPSSLDALVGSAAAAQELEGGRLTLEEQQGDWERALELSLGDRQGWRWSSEPRLYLCLGLLLAPSRGLAAPVVLVPARLELHRGRREIWLHREAEEALGNGLLVEWARRELGMDLGPLAALDDETDLQALWGELERRVRGATGVELRPTLRLCLLPPPRLRSWRDLQEGAAQLLRSDLVRHLLSGGSLPLPDPVGEVSPASLEQRGELDLPTICSLDSSQAAAAFAARAGRSFVLEAGPGSGRIQAMVGLLGACVHAGRRILVVSPRRELLQRLEQGLADAGLGGAMLSLFDPTPPRRSLLAELSGRLELPLVEEDAGWERHKAALSELRRSVSAPLEALHRPRAIGLSVWEMQDQLLRLAALPELPLPLRLPATLGPEELERRCALAEALSLAAEGMASPGQHPLRDCAPPEVGPEVEACLRSLMPELRTLLGQLTVAAEGLAQRWHGPPPETVQSLSLICELVELVGAGALPQSGGVQPGEARRWAQEGLALREEQQELEQRWGPALWALPLEELRAEVERWAGAPWPVGWLMLWGARRRLAAAARAGVPAGPALRLDLERACALQAAAALREPERAELSQVWRGAWSGEVDDLEGLEEAVLRLEALRSALARGRAEGLTIPEKLLAFAHPDMDPSRRAALRAAGEGVRRRMSGALVALDELVSLMGAALPRRPDGELPLAELDRCLERWEAGLPELGRWWGLQRSAQAAREAGLGALVEALFTDRLQASLLREATRKAVLSRVLSAVREGDGLLRAFEGQALERRIEALAALDQDLLELDRRRVAAALSQRRLAALEQLRESEVRLLQQEHRRPRGRVGPRHLLAQLPRLLPRICPILGMSPASVAALLPLEGARFDLVVVLESERVGLAEAIGLLGRAQRAVIAGDPQAVGAAGGAAESLLSRARSAGLPRQRLEWDHGRAWPWELLEPGPHPRHQLPRARLERSGPRVLRRRASELWAAAVGWLRERLERAGGRPSIALVTLGAEALRALAAALEEARRADPRLELLLQSAASGGLLLSTAALAEPRDEVLLCLGDRSERATLAQLAAPEGPASLWSVLALARQELTLLSPWSAADLPAHILPSEGARLLRRLLRAPDPWARPWLEAPGGLEVQVIAVVEEAGLRCRRGQGLGGGAVELVVEDPRRPGRVLLGICLDGPSMMGAPTTRDRFVLRPALLGRLGWRLHQLWSIDWWLRPERERERLLSALSQPLERGAGPWLAPLRLAVLAPPPLGADPYAAGSAQALAAQVARIVEVEGPVHLERVLRQIAALWGVRPIPARLRIRLGAVVERLGAAGQLLRRGEVLWPAEARPEDWEELRLSSADGVARELEHIPAEELALIPRLGLGLEEASRLLQVPAEGLRARLAEESRGE